MSPVVQYIYTECDPALCHLQIVRVPIRDRIAHSVFKQTDLNVSAHQMQQHTMEICCKMIQFHINELVKQIILYCRQDGVSARHFVGQLCQMSFDSVRA